MLGMIATFAQLEADMVSERTRDALAEVKAQGTRLGAPDMVRLGAGESVRFAQELYASGAFSHRTLAEELNRRGVPTAKGAKWWPKTVRAALMAEPPSATANCATSAPDAADSERPPAAPTS
jgi:DNA invertase Pin-like site-specific DNA recombinase